MKLRKGVTQRRQQGVPVSKSSPARTDFHLEGVWLRLARGIWIGSMLLTVVVLLLTLAAKHGQGFAICPIEVSCAVTPATARVLHRLSIASASYAIYTLFLALLQSLVFLGVGGFIFRHKSSNPVGLVASFMLVNFGLAPFFPPSTYPPDIILSNIYGLCIYTALGYFLVTFPDGHFVPRWSWLLVVLWLVQAILNEVPGPYNMNSWPPLLSSAEVVLTFGGTLGVLIYRYVRVFSSSQRQQAKWLLFGFGGVLVLAILYGLIGSLVPGLGAPDSPYQLANGTLTTLVFLLIPLSVGVAILRARLWDIDVLIRRTLVYSTLTAILALLYVGLVIGLASLVRLFSGQVSPSPVIIVASTLAIAAVFQPLRQRIQRIIDRRFYRRKYDAQKTLDAFSSTLRAEVDLDQLREHLITVVQQTMQPTQVSLWLRPPAHAGTQRVPWGATPPVSSEGR
jgi:putative effector of murein hydrolase LrgA (UPF0299 family)